MTESQAWSEILGPQWNSGWQMSLSIIIQKAEEGGCYTI